MLAMLIIIPEKAKQPTCPPMITFFGPDSNHSVKAINRAGFQVASFTVSGHRSDFTITRNHKPTSSSASSSTVCSSHTSNLSGTKHMMIHNLSATMTESRFEMTTPNGPIKWKIVDELDGARIWRDDGKNVLARGGEKDDKLEVFVHADEIMLDALLASWMTMCLDMSPGGKGLITGVKIAAHLVAHLAGGGLAMPSGN